MSIDFNKLSSGFNPEAKQVLSDLAAATFESIKEIKIHFSTHPTILIKYDNTADLMTGLLAISQPFMDVFSPYESRVNGIIAGLKAALAGAEPADKTMIDADIKVLESTKQTVINSFVEDVAAGRMDLLTHENNVQNAYGVGANNTIYAANHEAIAVAISEGKSINEALANSKVLLTQRHIGKPDGIGPFGGLLEMLDKLYSDFIFDERAFNAGDADLISKLQKVSDAKTANLAANKVLPFMIESEKMQLEATNLLIAIAKIEKGSPERLGLQTALATKCMDDLKFDEGGNLLRITSINEKATRAAARELPEEAEDCLDGSLQSALYHLLASQTSRKILLGGEYENGNLSKIVDPNYILRIFGITQKKAVGQFITPIMSATEVDVDAMNSFEILYKTSPVKVINPSTKLEVSKLVITDLNQLRRASGETKDGTDLSVAVGKYNAEYGEYAYRYPHEALVPMVISMKLLAESIHDNSAKFGEALLCMTKQDQADVFNLDHKDHKLSFLSKAKMMFQNLLRPYEAEAANIEAYKLLADEVIGGSPELEGFVEPDLFARMDFVSSDAHQTCMLGSLHLEEPAQ